MTGVQTCALPIYSSSSILFPSHDNIRGILERVTTADGKIRDGGVEELIDEIKKIGELESENVKQSIEANILETLKLQLNSETDWRERASIAAKIISLNL